MGITILPAPTQISRFSVLIYILLFFAIARISQAQTVKGKVVNSEQHPIEGATVIMQTLDFLYIDASISDADGTFVLNNCPSTYRLVVQHLLYQTRKIVGNEKNMGIIQLTPHQYALDEVVVKAERPFMKVENGRLGYNLSALPGNQTVNNV